MLLPRKTVMSGTEHMAQNKGQNILKIYRKPERCFIQPCLVSSKFSNSWDVYFNF